MLYNAGDIVRYAKELPKPLQAKNPTYRYYETPVNMDGRIDAAVSTLKNGVLYNINPIQYFLKEATKKRIPLSGNKPNIAAHKARAAGIPTNSIAEYIKNVKALRNAGKRSVKDVLINTERPAYVGQTAEILRQNKRKEK